MFWNQIENKYEERWSEDSYKIIEYINFSANSYLLAGKEPSQKQMTRQILHILELDNESSGKH